MMQSDHRSERRLAALEQVRDIRLAEAVEELAHPHDIEPGWEWPQVIEEIERERAQALADAGGGRVLAQLLELTGMIQDGDLDLRSLLRQCSAHCGVPPTSSSRFGRCSTLAEREREGSVRVEVIELEPALLRDRRQLGQAS